MDNEVFHAFFLKLSCQAHGCKRALSGVSACETVLTAGRLQKPYANRGVIDSVGHVARGERTWPNECLVFLTLMSGWRICRPTRRSRAGEGSRRFRNIPPGTGGCGSTRGSFERRAPALRSCVHVQGPDPASDGFSVGRALRISDQGPLVVHAFSRPWSFRCSP
jgi:hypothetical protein